MNLRLPENTTYRILLLVGFNILIFILLVILSVLFQFAVLGWGASANSPDFNIYLTSISHIVVLIYLAQTRHKQELLVVAGVILSLFIITQFVL